MPSQTFKYKYVDDKKYIFDIIRKKYVMCTPEEWVRQQLLHHFIFQLNFPASLINVEKQIKVGNRNKRFDILVFKNSKPWLLVECKQEGEKITKRNLAQVESYISALDVVYFIITNGTELHCFDVFTTTWSRLIPSFES